MKRDTNTKLWARNNWINRFLCKFVYLPTGMFKYIQILLVSLSLYFFTGSPVFAQEQYHFFYGKVIDQASRRPLVNVNLSITGTKDGTVTGKEGEFSFFTGTIPANLQVSHVGYNTKTILLDATSYCLVIYLSPVISELPEVEIKANTHEAFFKDDHYAVLDYEIDSNLVYLLIFRHYLAKAELICKNPAGDTVATSTPLYFIPDRLFKDCLGVLHVLSHDSGFQVFRQEKQLHLIHPVNLKKFDDVLKNCVAATPEVLYFQKVTDHGMGVEYFGVNRSSLFKKTIAQVKDEKKMKMLRRNPQDAQLLGSELQPDSRDDFVTWNFVHKILYRPVKTSLYRIGEFTCIFNNPERQIEFYDHDGSFSYKLALKIENVNDGRWTNDILIDEQTRKVYTAFISNGRYSLYEIDLNSGILKKQLTLFHYYPQKVKVFNNFVYYLFDESGEPDNKMLYRQKF